MLSLHLNEVRRASYKRKKRGFKKREKDVSAALGTLGWGTSINFFFTYVFSTRATDLAEKEGVLEG